MEAVKHRQLRVLSLQPWYGGSHRYFNDGWAANSRHHWETIGLSGDNWKWRMRFAAIELARSIETRAEQGAQWDAVFCTDMLNLAELKSIASPIRNLPVICYFHENQFAYPNRGSKQPDHHFLFTNFVSAIAADAIWFNSRFNLSTLVAGLKKSGAVWPEFDPAQELAAISESASVWQPGLSLPEFDFDFEAVASARNQRVASGAPLHLLWAARWEHDKNPADLLKALDLLHQQKVPFRLSVIGESSNRTPASIGIIADKYSDEIDYWGYQETRDDYWRALFEADVFISTANHEFFGISAAEAMAAGCWPLLPQRQSYPEILQLDQQPDRTKLFTYPATPKQLASRIRALHLDRNWDLGELHSLAQEKQLLNWKAWGPVLDDALDVAVI